MDAQKELTRIFDAADRLTTDMDLLRRHIESVQIPPQGRSVETRALAKLLAAIHVSMQAVRNDLIAIS